MPNDYFNSTSQPTQGAPGSSATIRAVFAQIVAAFDKLPTITANANHIVRVNASATALETVPVSTLYTSPAFSGTPTAPTAAPGTNTTQIATTGFVAASFAPLASPALSGTPTAPTAAPGTNTTQLATTAFVLANSAGLSSPAFTGTPTAPTATPGTNTTQLATTAFVVQQAFQAALPAQSGNTGKYLKTDGTSASWASSLPDQSGNGGKYLQTDGSNAAWTPVASAAYQEFTASGTWTKPAGATFVMVEAWGAGGAGGSGRRGAASSARAGGAGGGGGVFVERVFKASELASSVAVTIGAGGAGGAAVTADSTNGNAGTDGGNSFFGTYLTAFAGSGGAGGATTGSSSNQTFGGSSLGPESGTGNGSQNSGASGGGVSLSSNSGYSSYQSGPGGGSGGGFEVTNVSSGSGAGGGIVFQRGTGALPVVYAGTSGNNGVGRQGASGGAPGSFAVFGNIHQTMCFGSGTFAAAMYTGQIVTSANGTNNWTLQNTPPARWILHDGTQFVLLSIETNRCWTTTDFSTYTEKIAPPIPTSNPSASRFKFVNNRYFVCVGANIFYSTDLMSWTRTSPGASDHRDICWTGTNYVAVSNSVVGGLPAVIYSSDLSSWSTPASGGTVPSWACESDGAGNVVIQTTSTPFAQRSTNHGVNFTNVATTLVTGSNYRSLAYLNSTWLLAAANSLWSSTDGDTWTNRINATGDNLGGGFAYDGTTYVVGSSTDANTTAARTATSLATWTDRTITTINGAAGAGGNGGQPGAGGGGGGASVNGNNSGAGGNGGDGLVRVYTW